MEKQVVILYVATGKALMDVPVGEVHRFNDEFMVYLEGKYPEVLNNIRDSGVFAGDTEKALAAAVGEFKRVWK
jgi:F-type H+-transporting ATPase subunit alpha